MNRKKYIIIGSIGVVVVLVLLYFSVISSRVEPTVANSDYLTYEVAPLDPLVFRGSARARETETINYDVSLGQIETVHVEKGQQVQTGDELITYRNDSIKEEVATKKLTRERLNLNITNTETEINTTNAKIIEIENKLSSKKNELAKLNSVNFSNLEDYDEDVNNLAETEQVAQAVTQLEAELETYRQAISPLRQTLEGFNFDLKELNNSITQAEQKIISKITATFSGVVAERADNTSDPSKPILQILSNEVVIDGVVSEYDYYKLAQGQKVTIKPNSTAETIDGEIAMLSLTPTAVVDSESTVNFLFTVTPEREIQFGLSVQIFLEQTDLIIPETAVIAKDSGSYVFVYADGHVAKRDVTVTEINNQYNVTDGLSIGDTIIENPDSKIKDGQEVNIND